METSSLPLAEQPVFLSEYLTVKDIRPWRFNPYRLFSLWDMKDFYAQYFTGLSRTIQTLRDHMSVSKDPLLDKPPNSGEMLTWRECLSKIRKECEDLGFNSAVDQIDRISRLSWYTIPKRKFADLFGDLQNRIEDDLRRGHFLSISSEHLQYYTTALPFGEKVAEKIRVASVDIEEAGKCLALNRSAATVFHLMRVIEIGLQRFGKKLRIDVTEQSKWYDIVNKVNKVLKEKQEDMSHVSPRKQAEVKKMSAIASHLNNVRIAWRNDTMHPKATCTVEEAERIFTHVKNFMQELAEIL